MSGTGVRKFIGSTSGVKKFTCLTIGLEYTPCIHLSFSACYVDVDVFFRPSLSKCVFFIFPCLFKLIVEVVACASHENALL